MDLGYEFYLRIIGSCFHSTLKTRMTETTENSKSHSVRFINIWTQKQTGPKTEQDLRQIFTSLTIAAINLLARMMTVNTSML